MNIEIIGYISKCEKYNNYKNIYDMCQKTNVLIPKEVDEYFNYETPSDIGQKICLMSPCEGGEQPEYTNSVTKTHEEMKDTYHINLKKLKDVSGIEIVVDYIAHTVIGKYRNTVSKQYECQ